MAEQDVQGMLIRIEATAAQLISELGRADRAVASTSQKIDKNLSVIDQAFGRVDSTISSAVDKALGDLNVSVAAAYAHLDRLEEGLTGTSQSAARIAPGLNASTAAMGKAGISAGQYAQAMRLLPMQLSDVVSSLASGMPVWQVAIQQGGQVRDAFGGLGNAARGVASAVGPVAGTLGAVAAAAAVLLSAHEQGAAEARAYEQALILTGNAAGTSADALAGMAIALDQAGSTQHAAAAALAELAGSGRFAENQLGAIAEAALAMEEATGTAVADTVKAFSALADAPAAASAKLNEQYHYLTEAVYRQIRALEEQGRTSEAAKLATDTYAAALTERAGQIDEHLGALQRAWRGITGAAGEAWDAMLGLGREKTLEQQIGQLEGRLDNLRHNPFTGSFLDFGPSEEELNNALLGLRIQQQGQALIAESAAEEVRLNQERIAADQREQKAQESLNQAYVARLVSLKQSAALQGQNSEEARVRYETERGELARLGEAQKQALIGEARAIDAKRAAEQAAKDQAEASKKAAEAQKREAASFQQLLDTLLPADAASRRYGETLAALDKGLIAGTLSLDTYQSAVEAAWQALNKADWDKQNQQVKEANDQFKSLRDRLDPATVAAEQYAKGQDILNQRLADGKLSAEEYARLLGLLDQEYQQNAASSSEWARFTERQLDRVDQAFSDAWLNIGHGFDSFASSLKRAFEQMLAELAHMAITRPIMLQIGSALGIGGLTGSAMGTGLWGSLSGGSGVLGSLGGLYSAYKAGSGILGGITSAGKYLGSGASGVLGSLDSGLGQVVGKLLYGGASTYAPASFQLQSALSRMGASASSFAAQLGISEQALAKFGAALGVVGDVASVAGAAYNVYGGFKEGIGNGLTTLAGAAIGAFFGGPVGSAIGSTIGKFVGGALFGTWKIKDYGLALGVNNGDLNPQSYVYKKKSGLLSHKKKTTYDPLGGDLAQQMQDTFASTEDSVAALFEQLGYAIDQGTFDGLQIARSKISTKGKTQDEISKAIGDWFTQAGESINSYLNATLGTGLSYDIAGMTTFVNDLYAVNGLLDHLNVGLFSTNVAGGKLVEQLLGLTGGLDSLTSSVSTYYDQFFSDAEKQANTLEDVTQAFADANQTLPATRAEYRAMVESIDLTTEAGRSMFATLMNLAGQADSYYDIVEQRAQAVQAATSGAAVSAAKGALSTLSSAIGAEQQRLSDAYNAQVASINDRVGTANSAVSSLTAVGSSLDVALKQLAGSSEQATALLHEQAVATLRSALAFAQAGGSLAGFAGLQAALDSAGNIDSGRYSTLADLQREQGRTAGLIAQLQGVNGAQLTTEEGIVANLQAQLDQAKADYDLQAAGLDAQLSAAQAQLDALLGIDSGVKSVADALSLFVGAMQQAQALQDANASITSVIGPDGVKHQVASNGTILDPNGASMGLKVVGDQVVGTQSWNQDWRFNLGQDGQMSWAAGQQANLQAWAKSMGIPGFATGGDFGGGLRLVGEHGPELEVTGPSRIFNARQTADLLSGGGASAEELRGLRADLAQVFDALRAIAKHTMQTAKRAEFLERWDYDGMPTVRA
ncbi:phage tail length tape measure family protein [Azotobacter bryophylli]|uniref:Phage tail length tape measure family protein n=1 Tax=Azotobacter bryophylli TaxID=1986537 RepID=A0ABV7AN84_9GAMM